MFVLSTGDKSCYSQWGEADKATVSFVVEWLPLHLLLNFVPKQHTLEPISLLCWHCRQSSSKQAGIIFVFIVLQRWYEAVQWLVALCYMVKPQRISKQWWTSERTGGYIKPMWAQQGRIQWPWELNVWQLKRTMAKAHTNVKNIWITWTHMQQSNTT